MQPIGIVNSVFNSMTYVIPIGDSKECCLVDCGDVEKIIEQGWIVKSVLLTHAHFDHIYGLNRLILHFPNVIVYTNEAGMETLQNPKWNFSRYHEDVEDFVFNAPENVVIISEGNWISISKDLSFAVIETAGHEPSCLCFFTENCIFTGDAYIPGIKVVTSFPRSNKEHAKASESRIREFAKDRTVYAGHKIQNIGE